MPGVFMHLFKSHLCIRTIETIFDFYTYGKVLVGILPYLHYEIFLSKFWVFGREVEEKDAEEAKGRVKDDENVIKYFD